MKLGLKDGAKIRYSAIAREPQELRRPCVNIYEQY
jgi:hypothetical protein